MTLYVLEDMSSMENIDAGMFEEMPEEQEKGGLAAFLEMNQQRLLPGALAVILILVIVIVIMAVKHRRAKTEMESDEDEEE